MSVLITGLLYLAGLNDCDNWKKHARTSDEVSQQLMFIEPPLNLLCPFVLFWTLCIPLFSYVLWFDTALLPPQTCFQCHDQDPSQCALDRQMVTAWLWFQSATFVPCHTPLFLSHFLSAFSLSLSNKYITRKYLILKHVINHGKYLSLHKPKLSQTLINNSHYGLQILLNSVIGLR